MMCALPPEPEKCCLYWVDKNKMEIMNSIVQCLFVDEIIERTGDSRTGATRLRRSNRCHLSFLCYDVI